MQTKIYDPTKTVSLETETLNILQKEKPTHDHFIKSIHLNNDRRYEINLPFKENYPVLYDHFDLCKNH